MSSTLMTTFNLQLLKFQDWCFTNIFHSSLPKEGKSNTAFILKRWIQIILSLSLEMSLVLKFSAGLHLLILT